MAASTKNQPGDGWTPAVTLNLETAGTPAFEEAKRLFNEWAKAQPPIAPMTLQNGWHDVTPKLSEDFLRRNSGNRKATLSTVRKYAREMKIPGGWRPTGQPILVNEKGKLEDAAHRCWASYFGNVTFRSYIITDVPFAEDTFAFIDDCKPRSAADALYTSGNNGLSNILAAAIKLAVRYDEGTLPVWGKERSAHVSHREVLAYNKFHPSLNTVAHLVISDYAPAVEVIGHKATAVMFCWKVVESYGEDVLDEFLGLLTDPSTDADMPTEGYRARMVKAERANETLKESHRLALLIKAFNLHQAGQRISIKKGLHLLDNEPFPRIEPAERAMAAE